MRLIKVAGIVIIVYILLPAGLPSIALAAGATITGSISLSPTVECIGVIVDYSGDDDGDNRAVMQYRVSGGTWKTAPDMYADRTDTEYRGSIFWLDANTSYEVRVTLSDPDSVSGSNPISGSTTTRNDNPAIGGNYYYVATTGNDSTGDGTLAKPWKTIQKAASSVSAGATVLVRGGTYV